MRVHEFDSSGECIFCRTTRGNAAVSGMACEDAPTVGETVRRRPDVPGEPPGIIVTKPLGGWDSAPPVPLADLQTMKAFLNEHTTPLGEPLMKHPATRHAGLSGKAADDLRAFHGLPPVIPDGSIERVGLDYDGKFKPLGELKYEADYGTFRDWLDSQNREIFAGIMASNAPAVTNGTGFATPFTAEDVYRSWKQLQSIQEAIRMEALPNPDEPDLLFKLAVLTPERAEALAKLGYQVLLAKPGVAVYAVDDKVRSQFLKPLGSLPLPTVGK